jgi:hypothetical protein
MISENSTSQHEESLLRMFTKKIQSLAFRILSKHRKKSQTSFRGFDVKVKVKVGTSQHWLSNTLIGTIGTHIFPSEKP